MVADDPDCKINLKTFHCSISNDSQSLKKESNFHKPIPVVREVTNTMIQKNYLQIKQEIEDVVDSEMQRIIGEVID